MNNTKRYVASKTLEAPEWRNTTVMGGDARDAVSRRKQEDGATITLNGSAILLRALLSAGLVDELRLFLHPLVLGAGKQLFENVTIEPPSSSPTAMRTTTASSR